MTRIFALSILLSIVGCKESSKSRSYNTGRGYKSPLTSEKNNEDKTQAEILEVDIPGKEPFPPEDSCKLLEQDRGQFQIPEDLNKDVPTPIIREFFLKDWRFSDRPLI